MSKFIPFNNNSQSITFGIGNGITIENGTEDIIIYGDTSINKYSDPLALDKLIETLRIIKEHMGNQNNSKNQLKK
jgi:hypothetical protein